MALVAPACGDDVQGGDSGLADLGVRLDADAGAPDLGSDLDATLGSDVHSPDLGSSDLGAPDLGLPDLGAQDGGGLDAGGATGSAAIAAARAAPNGAVNLGIQGVYVTYRKPEVGLDPAGFFVQADALGPALFIVSTSSVSVGDQVGFRVTRMATQDAQRRALEITDLVVQNSGFDVTVLSQDLSAAPNVTANLGDYESELVVVTASITQAPGNGGVGHRGMDIETSALRGDPNFELRLPIALHDQLGLDEGCEFTVAHTPLWRFNAKAQVSAWTQEDFAGIACAPTRLETISAPSSSQVLLTFSRLLEPASLVDPASQITFDNGLVTIDASILGNTLLVTTSAQSPGLSYRAVVGAGLLDVLGGAVQVTGTFEGFLSTAVLRINELSAQIPNGCDLVELRVVEGGTVAGYTFRERTDLKFSLPGFIAQQNESILLHFNSNNASCRNVGAASETSGVAQYPSASYPLNFDTAYDLYTTNGGLVATNNVFTLLAPGNVIMDVLFASSSTVGNTASGTNSQAAAMSTAGEWSMVGGGVPPGGFVNTEFHAHAVQGLGVSTRALSLQRLDDLDRNTVADWVSTATTSSWGQLNLGQTEF